MSSSANNFNVGIGIGIILCGIVNTFIIRDTVSYVNMSNIEQVVKKCPNSEYIHMELIAGRGMYQHRSTYILCEDGSEVTMRVDNSLQ